ncbi:transposase family protein [Micromonospora sp. ALFpr18c]|uniref:transposase family protein n=1 Tax=Micromonospora sp. ALFpr18c TaxID=1458665 RepID=UPI001788B5C8|nr:transposase family protein [Micromonospora sp. ALFpr18c]
MSSSSPISPVVDHLAELALWEAELAVDPGGVRPLSVASSLLDRLRQVPDPQRLRGLRHPLLVILVLTACATLVAGNDSVTAIRQWAARTPQDVLHRLRIRRRRRPWRRPDPAPDTSPEPAPAPEQAPATELPAQPGDPIGTPGWVAAQPPTSSNQTAIVAAVVGGVVVVLLVLCLGLVGGFFLLRDGKTTASGPAATSPARPPSGRGPSASPSPSLAEEPVVPGPQASAYPAEKIEDLNCYASHRWSVVGRPPSFPLTTW